MRKILCAGTRPRTAPILVTLAAVLLVAGRALALEKGLIVAPVHQTCPGSQTRSITCGQTVTGTLDSSDCQLGDGTRVEFWTFSGQNGQTVTVTQRSTDFDSYLFLLRPDHDTIAARNDDGGGGRDSQIVFGLDQTATWYIMPNTLLPASGNYTLTLSCSGGGPPPSCTTDDDTLCLNNNRFKVEATYATAGSGSGNAHVVKLTADTGYLWFFSASNVETVIKVIDACSLNNRFWVFAGGLTDVGVNITVTDTKNGTPKPFSNPLGTTWRTITDTSAFATCP